MSETKPEAGLSDVERLVGPDLPMWWDEYLTLVVRSFVADASTEDVERAKTEMTAAARVAVGAHHRLLKCLGMRQPGEQAPFEAWAKASGYDTHCLGPRYTSQRTKDAERGWMARGHTLLPPNAELTRGEAVAFNAGLEPNTTKVTK